MKNITWLIVLGLVGFSVYFSGIEIPYYADDFQFVYDSPSSKILYYFSHNNPVNGFYRPIQASFLAIIQTYFGLNTLPIHLTQIILHIMFSWLIFVFMLRLGFSRLQAILGSAFMLLSPANVHAVLSNDTLSQITGTLFGCISLGLLWCSLFDTKDDGHNSYYMLSISAYILSLMSKESSISFFPLLFGIIFISNLKTSNRLFSKTSIKFSPYLIVTALYLIVRSFIVGVQPSFGPENYNFHIGMNIIKNIAMFFFGALVPTSSVTTFAAFNNGEYVAFAGIVMAFLVFFVFTVHGLWRANRPHITLLLAIFAGISLFPMALMNHVSELYVYNCMPFIAILVGVGLGKQLEENRTPVRRSIVTTVICVLFVSHIIAVQSKAHLMKNNGERASMLLDQIEPYLAGISNDKNLLLLNPADGQIEYSIFLMKGFNVLGSGGDYRIKQLSGRNDLTTKIVEASDIERVKSKADILLLNKETVQLYQRGSE